MRHSLLFAKTSRNGSLKTTPGRTLFHFAALCLGLTVLLLGCSGDRHEWFYPSLVDVRKAEVSTQSWIPDDILPASSRAIHVVGELSPSKEWCAFEFLPADSQRLLRSLKSVDVLPPPVNHVPNPYVSWWPSVLKGNLDAAKIRKAGFQLYVIERPDTSVTMEIILFAIDWPQGRGFFYLTGKPDSANP